MTVKLRSRQLGRRWKSEQKDACMHILLSLKTGRKAIFAKNINTFFFFANNTI